MTFNIAQASKKLSAPTNKDSSWMIIGFQNNEFYHIDRYYFSFVLTENIFWFKKKSMLNSMKNRLSCLASAQHNQYTLLSLLFVFFLHLIAFYGG